MHKNDDHYKFLTSAGTDMEFTIIKEFLESNGIQILTKEHGFGGSARNIYMGDFSMANIELYVKNEDYEAATALLENDESVVAEEEWNK